MKILYADPVSYSPTSAKYKYYNGVPDGLKENCDLLPYRKPFNDLNEVRKETGFDPDFVVFGFGWLGSSFFMDIKNLDVPTAIILFKPQNDLDKKFEFCRKIKADLVLTTIPSYKEYEEKIGIRTELITYGFDPNIFYPRNEHRKYDIGFSGALHQNKLYKEGSFKSENIRTKIGEIFKDFSSNGLDVFWNSSDNANTAYIDSQKEYASTLSNTKIWIATPAAYEDMTPRYFEVLSSGCVLLTPTVPDAYFRKNVLIPNKNCIEFKYDLSDFKEKVFNILKDENLRISISNYFNTHQRSHYSWSGVSQKIIELLKGIK